MSQQNNAWIFFPPARCSCPLLRSRRFPSFFLLARRSRREEVNTHFLMQHDRVVKVFAFSVGEGPHPPCLIMERMDGTLNSVLELEPLPLETRLEYILDICEVKTGVSGGSGWRRVHLYPLRTIIKWNCPDCSASALTTTAYTSRPTYHWIQSSRLRVICRMVRGSQTSSWICNFSTPARFRSLPVWLRLPCFGTLRPLSLELF